VCHICGAQGKFQKQGLLRCEVNHEGVREREERNNGQKKKTTLKGSRGERNYRKKGHRQEDGKRKKWITMFGSVGKEIANHRQKEKKKKRRRRSLEKIHEKEGKK